MTQVRDVYAKNVEQILIRKKRENEPFNLWKNLYRLPKLFTRGPEALLRH